MAIRFMGKNPHRKVVRQIPNNRLKKVEFELPKRDKMIEAPKQEEKVELPKEEKITENKEVKKDTEMADERLEKIEKIVGAKAPKRTVKREKKEKGLIERTDNSTILLTEDNKMLLND